MDLAFRPEGACPWGKYYKYNISDANEHDKEIIKLKNEVSMKNDIVESVSALNGNILPFYWQFKSTGKIKRKIHSCTGGEYAFLGII